MVTHTAGPEAAPRLDGIALDEAVRRGSDGGVWRGRDLADGRPVIVRTFETAPRDRARLAAVGARLRRLDHPGVARLRDCRDTGGLVAWVMEEVDGVPLEALLAGAEAPLGERSLRRLLLGLLDALDAVHGAGVVHRDVKPGNILVRGDGTPVLVDFDAAAVIGEAADGDSLQTPGYAAPEQGVTGGGEGPWTDLYGLAAVAYRVLSGTAPPDARTRLADDRMVPARRAGAGRFSESFLSGIDRALALDPAVRPATARAWRAALASGGEAPAGDAIRPPRSEVGPDDDGPPTVRVRRRLAPPLPRPGTRKTPGTAPAPAAPPPIAGRRRKRLGALLAAALVVGLGVWRGYAYYLSEIKAEWIVDAAGGGDTRSIAEAMARARDDAVITIRPGTYAETLALTRPQRLQGDGDAAAIVVLGAGSAPCLTVGIAGAAVRGLTLTGGASGGGGAAPCLEVTAGDVTLERVTVSSLTGPAVRISGDAAPRLIDVTATGDAAPALVITDAATPVIGGGTLIGGAAPALVVADRAAPSIAGTAIRGGDQAGVLITGGAPELRDTDIADIGRAGIEVRGGATPTIAGNRIRNAGEAGLFIHEAGGRIEDNVIEGSGFSGVVLGAGALPEFIGNRIEGSAEHGVLALTGAGGRVTGNAISGNKGFGVARAADAETAFETNEVSGNGIADRRIGKVVFGDEPEEDAAEPEAAAADATPPATAETPGETAGKTDASP